MKITKKNEIVYNYFTKNVFNGCNLSLIEITEFDIKVSIWYCSFGSGTLLDLIKILQVIEQCPLIETNKFEVWRAVGYYNSTDNITLDFRVKKDELSKILKQL